MTHSPKQSKTIDNEVVTSLRTRKGEAIYTCNCSFWIASCFAVRKDEPLTFYR